MDRTSHAAPALGLAAVLGCALVAGCEIEPEVPELRWDVSEDTRERLDVYPAVQDQIRGSLEMLFGTPSHPAYLLTEELFDAHGDPNYPQYSIDDLGSGEIDEETWERIVEDNERRFAPQLQALRERRFDDVVIPSWMPNLRMDYARWLEEYRVEGRVPGVENPTDQDFAASVESALHQWYPSLRDSSELYRQQCLHCHGVEGGGDGPTAPYLNPPPRDYRKGKFKFTAVADGARPRREDLYRILVDGAYGTAMPSFERLTEAELQGLVDYVRLLSIRGEVESFLVDERLSEEVLYVDMVTEWYSFVWDRWHESDDHFVAWEGEVPQPDDTYPGTSLTYVEQGKRFYFDDKASDCLSCHGAEGRGNGPSAFVKDAEGKDVLTLDDWGNPLQPRDLTRGVFRAGRRPIDIYRRIYGGITGTPMPAHSNYEPDVIWALAHYVRSIHSDAKATARFASAAQPAGAGQRVDQPAAAGHRADPPAAAGH